MFIEKEILKEKNIENLKSRPGMGTREMFGGHKILPRADLYIFYSIL